MACQAHRWEEVLGLVEPEDDFEAEINEEQCRLCDEMTLSRVIFEPPPRVESGVLIVAATVDVVLWQRSGRDCTPIAITSAAFFSTWK